MTIDTLTPPYQTTAIKIEQPLGTFYVVSLPADLLLKITYSTPAIAIKETKKAIYSIFGSQRSEKEKRLKDIADFINTVDAAFPNSIIIGANYDIDGNHITNESRWTIKTTDEDIYQLVIPSDMKIASLIDGQHRLHAFDYAAQTRKKMSLLCAVYLDIPLPYHAQIFATINFNQQKVPRSLAYELFGFNLDEGSSSTWAPETLAVYLVRLLNIEETPFKNHIKLGVQDGGTQDGTWKISMATIVDGILSLISTNPKKDRYRMHKKSVKQGRDRHDLSLSSTSNPPLRKYFIDCNDKRIYLLLIKYFTTADKLFWNECSDESYIKKTVGIQALFEVLKEILTREDPGSATLDVQMGKLGNAKDIDFADNFFQASGKGRNRIKNVLLLCMKILAIEDIQRLSGKDRSDYIRICSL